MATLDEITANINRNLKTNTIRPKRTTKTIIIQNNDPLCLVNLPVEIIIKIFEYLPVHDLSGTVTLVCKRFARILNDDVLWKRLFRKIISKNTNVPVMLRHPCNWGLNETGWRCGRDVLWRDLAVQLSLIETKWKINNDNKIVREFNEHYSPADALKIIGDGSAVVSVGRDRTINVWKINPDNLYFENLLRNDDSHSGWIWDVDSCTPDSFYTGGFDSKVFSWILSDELVELNSFECGNPVMAVSCTRGLVVAGLSIPRIILIDPRIGVVSESSARSLSVSIHRSAITDVQLVPDKNLLTSISEDKTLSFFDIRQHRLAYKTVEITANDSFPRCLGYYREVLYIGDSRGNVHLYSLGAPSSQVDLINVSETRRVITSIVPHLGGITVGSRDTHVRMIYPTNPPILLWKERMSGEVTSVDQTRDLLAVSSGSGYITLFRPYI